MARLIDLNPIVDEGASKSIAEVFSAAKFSDLLGVEFE